MQIYHSTRPSLYISETGIQTGGVMHVQLNAHILSPIISNVTHIFSPIITNVTHIFSFIITNVTHIFSPIITNVTHIFSPIITNVTHILSPIITNVTHILSPIITNVTHDGQLTSLDPQSPSLSSCRRTDLENQTKMFKGKTRKQ